MVLSRVVWVLTTGGGYGYSYDYAQSRPEPPSGGGEQPASPDGAATPAAGSPNGAASAEQPVSSTQP